jgi:acyl-CoA reductase-like NAD-dependent aldehyde dehydrogenase
MSATNPAPPHARNPIDGQWVDSPKRGSAATGAVLGSYADAELEHARTAVAAARRAFTDGTLSRDRQLRARALNELADRMTERRDDLVTLLAMENGKTLGP